MKVSHNYGPQTRPSAQGLGYMNVQYNPNQFGAALGQALGGFGQALEVAQERRKENNRFDALTNLTEFETQTKLQIEQLKQDTPENAANFFEQAETTFAAAEANFLNSVPAEYQDEFKFRTAQMKQGVIFDTFKWDFEQQNLFFTNKINEHLTAAQVKLQQGPNRLEEERGAINDLIESSGLTPIEKERQRRIANGALEAITYKSKLKQRRTADLVSPSGGIANKQLPPQAGGILNAIAKRESGGKYDIRYDGGAGSKITSFVDHPRTGATITGGSHKGQTSTASGRYQFIASTWDAAAAGAGVRDFTPESQDAAAWYWAQKTFADYTGKRKSLTQAIADEDWSTIRKAMATQWEGVKHMTDEEFAAEFKGGAGSYGDYSEIYNDPAFSNLSFSDRQALENDAFNEAGAEYNALLKQQDAAEKARINDLYVGLYDGTKGQADINAMRDEGILRDYDDINKAATILEKRLGDQRWSLEYQQKMTHGGVWVPEDEDDRKRMNAGFGDYGRAALESGSDDYVQQQLLPIFDKAQMVAPDAANLLTSMTRQANAGQAAFAFETLRQMRERMPEAFGAQFDEQTQKQLDFWETRRNYYSPEELVAQIQNRGVDQAARQAQSLLRADAKELTKDLSLEDIQPLYESIIPWQSANVPISSRGSVLVTKEYKALYEDAFVQTGGNVEQAKALADKAISRVWTLTNIGGAPRIARFPPEVAGYKKHNGGYEWIDKAVRRELGLGRSTQFELVADETTEIEIIKRQQAINAPAMLPAQSLMRDPSAGAPVRDLPRPSYFVAVTDDNGIVRLATNPETGRPIRMDFVVDKETLMEEDAAWRAEQARADRAYIKRQYERARFEEQSYGGRLVPSELEESYQQVIEEEKQEGTSEYLNELRGLGDHLRQMQQPVPLGYER